MTLSLWIPFGMGLSCIILVFPTTALSPDTRPIVARVHPPARPLSGPEANIGETAPFLQNEADLDVSLEPAPTEDDERPEKSPDTLLASIRIGKQRLRAQLYDMKQLVTSSKNYGLCLIVFLVTTLARSSLYILLQYTSKRYHQSFAEVRVLGSEFLSRKLILVSC